MPRPILPLEITEDAARAAHARVADAAKVRITGEIIKDTPSNVIYERSLSPPQSRARAKSTTSPFDAKLAGFERS